MTYKYIREYIYDPNIFKIMNSTTTEGSPNRETLVNTKNGRFTIVASVRMHSDGGHRGVEEDRMICLAVDEKSGELVSWDSYWVGEMKEAGRFGWSGGYYQPYREDQDEDKNSATDGFRRRVMHELNKCIGRTLGRQHRALTGKDYRREK
tara:strand:- start:399 stop:848 length:450 start_codon:yes stop_codon:yes gene_type:complete